MSAWHNRSALKAEVWGRMLQHRAEDSIIQQAYQMYSPEVASKYRGCLIGCTLPIDPDVAQGADIRTRDVAKKWHQQVEDLYGVPVPVGLMLDQVFESVPVTHAPAFALASIEAISVGADLSLTPMRLALDILTDPVWGIGQLYYYSLIEDVAALYQSWISGNRPTEEAWVNCAEEALQLMRSLLDGVDLTYLPLYTLRLAAAHPDDPRLIIEEAVTAWRHEDDNFAPHSLWLSERCLHHLRNAPVAASVALEPAPEKVPVWT